MKNGKVEDKKMIKVTGGQLNIFENLTKSPAPIYEICNNCKQLVLANVDGTCPKCHKMIDVD